jgi:hypothetical protein
LLVAFTDLPGGGESTAADTLLTGTASRTRLMLHRRDRIVSVNSGETPSPDRAKVGRPRTLSPSHGTPLMTG